MVVLKNKKKKKVWVVYKATSSYFCMQKDECTRYIVWKTKESLPILGISHGARSKNRRLSGVQNSTMKSYTPI